MKKLLAAFIPISYLIYVGLVLTIFKPTSIQAFNYEEVHISSHAFGGVNVDSVTAVAVPSSNPRFRRIANYANMSSTYTVFFATWSSVTSATGFPLFPETRMSIDLTTLRPPTTFFFILNTGSTGTVSVRFWDEFGEAP